MPTTKMKASIYKVYGGPEVISYGEVERPEPKPDELQVKVMAATVNRTDCAMLTAKPHIMRLFCGLTRPKKQILGTDFAGQVVATGSEVKHYKIGDRVMGFHDMGVQSHAQYLTIREKNPMVLIPEGLSYVKATASIEGAHYAFNFINKVKIELGQEILVNGATGAIGSAVVQLLKIKGATVTAVCDSYNIDTVRSLGADHIIDYLREDFTDQEKTYHFVCDAVGKSSFNQCKRILKDGGIYISSEVGNNGDNIFKTIQTQLFKQNKRVIFPIPSNVQESLNTIKSHLEEGKFTPLIDRTYGLHDVPIAFTYVLKGFKTGNVVIDMSDLQ